MVYYHLLHFQFELLGGPISIEIKNKDYENWVQYMNPMEDIDFETKKVDKVRPGHADLVGCLKYDFDDLILSFFHVILH